MRFIDYFCKIVGKGNFEKYYNTMAFGIDVERFKKLPLFMQLNAINTYLLMKHGVFIYSIPTKLYLYKISLSHQPIHELFTFKSHNEVMQMVNFNKYYPDDEDVIKLIKPIDHYLRPDIINQDSK